MANEIVVIDRRLDQILAEHPSTAIQQLLEEYRIAYSKQAFVAALAAKLVLTLKRSTTETSANAPINSTE